MKKILITVSVALFSISSFAGIGPEDNNTNVNDTTKVIDIEEVVVIATPKEHSKLRSLPTSVSLISQKEMQENQITSLKGASALVPNFYMPDYGSRLTSAIYIRGIGSRINTPAVGLYVDNIPYIDKSAFDFNFYDIERLDILRGPQGTLYGRNAMGGLVRINTKSPFSYQGTDLKLGYATKDNHRNVSLTHYHRISNQFAFAAGGYYEGSNGFFRHDVTNKKVDGMEAGGGRIRAIWIPLQNLKLDFTASYDYTDQGGYPYYYTGSLTGGELYPDNINKITNNRESKYRRGLFNTGLNLEYQTDKIVMNAVTGFQNLRDRMYMDQDYLPVDIYTIEQKQRQSTLSEEITFKSKGDRQWNWLTGVSGFYQWLHTEGPVTFYNDGISSLIEGNVNRIFQNISAKNPRAPQMSLDITDESMLIQNKFDTPTLSTALFHESTFKHLFVDGLSLTIGARLEYEKLKMDYISGADVNFNFLVQMGKIFSFPLNGLKASPKFEGDMKNDYWQVLPKFALKYDFDKDNSIYVSVTKGYRSGGYNVQMFSDIVQNDMKNKMIDAIVNAPQVSAMKQMILGMITQNVPSYGVEQDVKGSTTYKPEYSWNYELGSHLNLFKNKLRMDLAVFYMNTHDQQIAKFAENGFGRMMVNAGKSESYGAEISLNSQINRSLSLFANYGYTHATFKNYDGGTNTGGVSQNYTGNYVPFVPMHTLNIGGDYAFFFKNNVMESLTIGANYTGAGKIYWNESNGASEDFNGTLNAHAALQLKNGINVNIWGRNLTDHRYTTFYFESMNRGYKQINKPLQLGIDLRYQF
ncbi:MAG: TonB-dependent receptor [Phocaeicola sp.]|uniref:TonB-dependent receptor n=1 Tax=Phocaeicola TaxID=909656 RepID=UPI00234E4A64|nr:TonB-dependent receptor [Phocaeicola oris]MCE2617594.1 TonB-dependent receptor [Phocaeicola oris]